MTRSVLLKRAPPINTENRAKFDGFILPAKRLPENCRWKAPSTFQTDNLSMPCYSGLGNRGLSAGGEQRNCSPPDGR